MSNNKNTINVIEEIIKELSQIKVGERDLYSMISFKLANDTEENKHIVGFIRDRQVLSMNIYPKKKVEFYICSDRKIMSTHLIKKEWSNSNKKKILKYFFKEFIPEAIRVVFCLYNGMELEPIDWSNS